MNWTRKHDLAILVTMLLTLLILAYLSMFAAVLPPPPWDAVSFHLFFYHIPIAWTAYLSFGVVFTASVGYLRTKSQTWDMIAASSAELGVLLTTLALLTGSLWSRAQLGYYWTWEDSKLFTTFILWMAYIGYIALRAGIMGEGKARLAAVFGIISFVFVPLSFFSSRFLISVHTSLTSYPFPAINGIILLIGVIAFTLMFFLFLRVRYGLERQGARLEAVKEGMEELA